MKINLALHRKLLLLVAIPLCGALLFAGIQITRSLLELRTLARVSAAVDFAAELGAARHALLAEQRDAADLSLDSRHGNAYRDHIGATTAAVAKLRTRLADDAIVQRTEVRDATSAILAAHERLTDARNFFSRPAGGENRLAETQAFHARYTEISELVLAATALVGRQAGSAAIRSRMEGLVELGRIANAAETERMLLSLGFTQEKLPIATFARTINATAKRNNLQSNIVLMAPPELHSYWQTFLANPSWARAAALPGQIYTGGSAESHTFKREFQSEWASVTRDRNRLVDEAESHLLADLRALIDSQQAAARQQLFQLAVPAAILALLSLGFGFILVRRLEHKLGAAHTGLATGVAAIARSVAAATEAAQRLAEGASKEAAGLEQTGSSLVALTAVNQKNVATAKLTVEQMSDTGKLVGNSREAMQSLADTMAKISESSNATFRIVKTINEIAFQTSILALNASIEAARAGAAGTGFAVVADEVRNLAKRAAEATAETGRLVDEARAAIESGSGLSDEVVAALRDVSTNASKSGELMTSIHSASEQMLQNMQHINTGNRSLETVTQQNAAIADRNMAAASAIVTETKHLQDTIGGLERLLVGAY
jgi:methyl-accepting chemotaxis protein